MGSCATQSGAAAAAGFSDPAGEADRLLARPEVRSRVIDILQRKAVKWEQLLDWSLHRLQDVLAPMPVICDHKCDCGRFCGATAWTPPEYKPETILYAVKINLDTAQKLGLGESLRDRAKAEDEDSTKSLAVRILGKRSGVERSGVLVSFSNGQPVKPDEKPSSG